MIANESSLAVGTIYRYFTSKEELFVAIVFNAISLMHNRLEEIVKTSAPAQHKLENTWNLFFDFYEENPMYYQALLFLHDPGFSDAFSESMHETVSRFSGKNFRLLSQMIKEGMADKTFRSGNSREVADFLWGTFVGLVHLTETRKNFNIKPNDLKKLHHNTLAWIKRAVLL